MQSKGTLGSVVAGVIAIFLVLVCLFYLSFSMVSSHYEGKAREYAQTKAGGTENLEGYNAAYKYYMDSIAEEPVYMGYTYNDVQKWGVGLGLDLKGGMNVILQVNMADMLKSMGHNDNVVLDKAILTTDSIVAQHPNEDYIGTFVDQYRALEPQADFSVVFADVIKDNGTNPDNVKSKLKAEVQDRVNTSAANVLRNRIDSYGVVSPNIQVLQGKDGQILLELPGVKEHERVRELLQRSANLEFYETYNMTEITNHLRQLDRDLSSDSTYVPLASLFEVLYEGQPTPLVGYATAANRKAIDEILNSPAAKTNLPNNLKLRWEVKPMDPQHAPGCRKDIYGLIALRTQIDPETHQQKARLTGDCVVSARSDFDNLQGNVVSMTMNNTGAREWANITRQNLGKPVAILLDDQVYSYPNVNSVIEGGSSQITGHFTVEEARDLANVLKSGKMTARVEIISDMVVGPTLGKQAIEAGFMSFIIALVLLMIFMICIYGAIPGIVANLGLICNIFFTFGILASFQAVLTLSGIAGIVLALGMAVDANVLIFERAKEELRAGKNVRTAIADGYSNAFSAIFDSNLTSVITGIILLLFGTGPIKGFATTLIIGIVCSFFTAVYLTRIVFIVGAKSKPFQKLTFSTKLSRNLFENTSYNFLGMRKVSFTVVLALVVVVIGSLFVRGLNQGIDFSGGRNYVVKFDHPVNTSDIQAKLQPLFENSTVSVITIENSNQVRISTNYKITDTDPKVEKEIVDILYSALMSELRDGMTPEEFSTTDETQGILSSQKVGPTVADDMKRDAYIAVALSLLAMFLYILIRFRNVAFSVGALAAVAFTAFAIIGFYSIFWGILPFAMEIDQTFIAAILTVIGYQINDTVVVFDRVRENVGLYPKQDFFTTINRSINSTLSRTIMTSGSTLLVLLCIFILGGDAIRSFTFAMIFGVIIGTLATIYVAAPVAFLTDSRRNRKAVAKA